MHIRRQIRDNRQQALRGLPLTGSRVKIGQTRPLGEQYDPTLLIYTSEPQSGWGLQGNPASFGRFIDLFIDVRVVTGEPSDTTPEAITENMMDAVAEQVEAQMSADPKFGGLLSQDSVLVESLQVVEARGDRHHGVTRMRYRCPAGINETDDTD